MIPEYEAIVRPDYLAEWEAAWHAAATFHLGVCLALLPLVVYAVYTVFTVGPLSVRTRC